MSPSSGKKTLLVVEDDAGIQTQLKWAMSKEYRVVLASDRSDALRVVEKDRPDVITLDLGLPPDEDGVSEGLACLAWIRENAPSAKVVVVTGNEDRENALKAVGMGAYDFYQKPVNMEVLSVIIQRAFHLSALERENVQLRDCLTRTTSFDSMIGSCPAMEHVFGLIRKVAGTDATALITGESGTGKELVALAIHSRSFRKNGPFVVINCGAIPENLLESELFGYEKGAFTDAKTRKIGLIEKANGGTLFLDEIGDLPLSLQVKLLRVLQERKVQRVGGTEPIEVDIRIVAATNADLQSSLREGRFRDDLYYRLSVIQIHLPPLRERGDDIVVLARNFLHRYAGENNRRIDLSIESLATLQSYHWPGNVRELENRIQRAVIMADGALVTPADLSLSYGSGSAGDFLPSGASTHGRTLSLREVRARAEMEAVKSALQHCEGNISMAAKILDASRPTVHALIKRYNLGDLHEEADDDAK